MRRQRSGTPGAHAAAGRGPARPPRHAASRRSALPRERLWVALLLVLHAGLAVWGVARNSVTFDENFHLPAGVLIVARGDYSASVAQPPLVKALCAVPVLALGGRLPSAEAMASGDEGTVGESFMRLNAARYHALFLAARLVVVALSLLLALLVWWWSRRLHGPRGALLSLALYALAPEALAHAGVVGMDLATGLASTAVMAAFWMFCRSGRWRWWAWTALATGAAFLVRFSAVQLVPALLALAVLGAALGRLRRPRRVWIGLLLLVPATWLALAAGYAGQLWLGSISALPFRSETFRALAHAHPGWRLPVPVAWLSGLDYLSLIGQAGAAHTYLLGRIHEGRLWYYFPLALVFKWPLGLLGALGLRAVAALRHPPGPRRRWHAAFLLVPAAVMLGTAMAAGFDVGVRYLFPLVPLAAILCGGLMRLRCRAGRTPARAWRLAAVALAALLALETALAAPWYLSFFNWPSGGPGGGDRLLNDSNVDWGQGLIALRDEMRRRGIGRIHLAYHGTTDPAIYGIEYVPYLGGTPGPESEWLAVSSYYFVGLSQRMMTPRGRTDFLRLDFSALWGRPWAARPAGCLYLFPLSPRAPEAGP